MHVYEVDLYVGLFRQSMALAGPLCADRVELYGLLRSSKFTCLNLFALFVRYDA